MASRRERALVFKEGVFNPESRHRAGENFIQMVEESFLEERIVRRSRCLEDLWMADRKAAEDRRAARLREAGFSRREDHRVAHLREAGFVRKDAVKECRLKEEESSDRRQANFKAAVLKVTGDLKNAAEKERCTRTLILKDGNRRR